MITHLELWVTIALMGLFIWKVQPLKQALQDYKERTQWEKKTLNSNSEELNWEIIRLSQVESFQNFIFLFGTTISYLDYRREQMEFLVKPADLDSVFRLMGRKDLCGREKANNIFNGTIEPNDDPWVILLPEKYWENPYWNKQGIT